MTGPTTTTLCRPDGPEKLATFNAHIAGSTHVVAEFRPGAVSAG
ncbi:MAG TPA: hypothetical protein VH063_15670 [Gaiellaceae bacterium]|jgi:hypothetical protein|nr:hypothetical protein [Gaiellaceae bacterium]